MPSHASRNIAATVGANIRVAREARGLTQRQVAATLDIDPMLVSRWERGLHRPSAYHEQKIAESLFDGDIGALYLSEAA